VYEQHYVQIDGKWHTAGSGERTECGMVIPYPGTPYTREVPDAKVHCGAELVEGTTDIREEDAPPMPFAAPEPTAPKASATKAKAKK
jgi:hypothetical protein